MQETQGGRALKHPNIVIYYGQLVIARAYHDMSTEINDQYGLVARARQIGVDPAVKGSGIATRCYGGRSRCWPIADAGAQASS